MLAQRRGRCPNFSPTFFVNVSWLMRCSCRYTKMNTRPWSNVGVMLGQCRPVNIIRWYGVGLMLYHHLCTNTRRYIIVFRVTCKPILAGHCTVYVTKINKDIYLHYSSIGRVSWYPMANTKRCPNVVSMSAHPLQRWRNIETTLGQLVVETLTQCWFNVGPPSATLD